MKTRPYILSIAGFDPSSGAGLTSDVKTSEALKCYGLSICTANTIQNDVEFIACHWTPIDIIKSQITILFDRFEIEYIKIGIVENWDILLDIISFVLLKNPKVKIILDPVLQSSSEFQFHDSDENTLHAILDKIYLITPNYNEIKQLFSNKSIEETIIHIQSKTNLFLKGGHYEDAIGKDQLFLTNGKQYILNPKQKDYSEKHGSGCVLSTAIASYLALGFPLLKACYRAKRYTEKFLTSNKTLLGTHL